MMMFSNVKDLSQDELKAINGGFNRSAYNAGKTIRRYAEAAIVVAGVVKFFA